MARSRSQLTEDAVEIGQRIAYDDALSTLRIYRKVVGVGEASDRMEKYLERKLEKLRGDRK